MEDLQQALKVLQIDACEALTPELIRRQYLKLALKFHPDKNPGSGDASTAQFRALGDAYTLALRALAIDEAAHQEAARTQALLDLFLRALKGEDVHAELDRMGCHRPSAQFGVDLGVRFDARLPAGDENGEGAQVDVAAAFREAFNQEGLTEEGDPIDGYVFAPGEEIC